MRSRRREGPSTFLTIVFSFCTALVIFAVLRSLISDPAAKIQAPPQPILIDQGQVHVHDAPKALEIPQEPFSHVAVVQTPVEAPLQEGEEQKHLVKERETLSSISKKYYGTETKWEKIWEANKTTIPNKNKIRPGITLVIPDQQQTG